MAIEVTAYQRLGVHPSAPPELISACYWAVVAELRASRQQPDTDIALHQLTQAYETVADPARRAEYDLSIGGEEEPLSRRLLPNKRSVFRRFRRSSVGWSVDPHEVLGLDRMAPQVCVDVAYTIMRNVYLRLSPGSERRTVLLALLDESQVPDSDVKKRAQLPLNTSEKDPRRTTSRTAPLQTARKAAKLKPGVRANRVAVTAGAGWSGLGAISSQFAAFARTVWSGLRKMFGGWRTDDRTIEDASEQRVASPDELFLGRLASTAKDARRRRQ